MMVTGLPVIPLLPFTLIGVFTRALAGIFAFFDGTDLLHRAFRLVPRLILRVNQQPRIVVPGGSASRACCCRPDPNAADQTGLGLARFAVQAPWTTSTTMPVSWLLFSSIKLLFLPLHVLRGRPGNGHRLAADLFCRRCRQALSRHTGNHHISGHQVNDFFGGPTVNQPSAHVARVHRFEQTPCSPATGPWPCHRR